MGRILSQCIRVLNHNIHFEYLAIVYVNYTSIELKLFKKFRSSSIWETWFESQLYNMKVGTTAVPASQDHCEDYPK